MKNKIIALASLFLATLCAAQTVITPNGQPLPPANAKTAVKVDTDYSNPATPDQLRAQLGSAVKERDDARTALANAGTQLQQSQIVAEYWKAIAEKLAAEARVMQAQNDNTVLTNQLAAAQARIAELEAAAKPTIPPAKK